MSRTQMFGLGALGGLLPVLVSMVTVDLAPIIDHMDTLTRGICVGYGIRVIGLLVLGGTVAVLNSGVKDPFSLVQLGIAAPALVTSFINSAPPPSAQANRASLAIVSIANAQEAITERRIQVAGGFLGDVINGMGTRLDSAAIDNLNRQNGITQQNIGASPNYPASPAPVSGAGAFCSTPVGRFGPGPINALGAPCNITGPNGPIAGVVTN